MMAVYRVKLSKFISYILRHAPDRYDLELDGNGYAVLEKVLAVMRRRFRHFRDEDLFELVKEDSKGRFEIKNGKIRAMYGHSIEVCPGSESVMPPKVLYHGTTEESAGTILVEGLNPMGRCFVHLSVTAKEAYSVGKRHSRNPVILEIMAGQAALGNIEFYKAGNLFLARHIPARYIKIKS